MSVSSRLRSARAWLLPLLAAAIACGAAPACAAGGPLGIDHRLSYDNSGIWKRSNQLAIEDLTLATVVGGALWEGGKTRLGKTFWQSLDSSVLGAVSSTVAKEVFTRARPIQGNDPNAWFKGSGHYSFPSGEVTFVSAAVTPFVLEYGNDHPGVYALELLPLYDGIARMKSQAHWQTDVLAGFALGTAAGYFAHERNSPFILGLLPHGFEVGLKKRW
ncbi:MAG: phosphatase PAP2 family protein [Betaproteobacteria bacterium]|nr:phosphatase PAP2 family protein [Betaproteobacteria bacterium]